MTKYTTEYIFKKELSSMKRLAKNLGYTIEVYAKATLKEIEQANKQIADNGSIPFVEKFDNYKPETLINWNKKQINNLLERVISRILQFNENYDSNKFYNHVRLKQEAELKGYDGGNWLENYLKSIPIILVYDLLTEAHVQYLDDKAQCIVISQFLKAHIENNICQILLNSFYPMGNINGTFAPAQMQIPPFDDNSVGRCIYSFIGKLSGKFEHLYLPSPLTSSGATQARFFPFREFMPMFIIAHEFSHILLCHAPGAINKTHEVEADILAVNLLMNKRDDVNRILDERQLFQIHGLKFLSPIILMKLLTTFNGWYNWSISDTHPNSLTRARYLITVLSKMCEYNKDAWTVFCYHLADIQRIFDLIFKQLKLPNNYESTLDLDYLKSFQFKIADEI